MSEQYPYQQFPSQFAPPPPPRKRHRARNWAIAVAALAVVGGIAGGATSGGKKHVAKPSQTPHSTPHTSATTPSDDPANPPPLVGDEADPAPVYIVPTKADFVVTLKILTKDCFGSAGCNVTYRPILAQNQPAGSFDPSITYDVTYTVGGGVDGAQTDTLYVTGDVHEAPNDGMAQTGSSGAKLTAKVTTVEAE
jgi:hypothetical protein